MRNYIALFIIACSIISCNRFNNKDDKKDNSKRIVCISKQYSEIIYALNAQKDLVGVDLSSTYPPEIKNLPTVGYHRALSSEAILALKPNLILHDNNIGPEHVVSQLEKLKIPMKVFTKYQATIAGTDSLIREIGKYFGKEKQADSLCAKLDNDMKFALENTNKYKKKPKVLIIHFGRASNVYLVMTKKSIAAKMLEWAGGEMAVNDEKGMKLLSPEIIAAANPDIILLTDFGYDRLNNGKDIEKLPGINLTEAFKNHRIYRIEEHDLVYLGPRTGENILLIQQLIHQDEQ
ncbi:MAG TPA: ABC transporter substrate-binding protein [Candidatus Kapabacteria bacterium]|nr:ABC transporter substrate-binding protein [Candidatus Kapabacteria bacterium]